MPRKRSVRRHPAPRPLENPTSSGTVDPSSCHDVPHVTHASSLVAVSDPCVASSEVAAVQAVRDRDARGGDHAGRGFPENVPVFHARPGVLYLVPPRPRNAPSRELPRVTAMRQLPHGDVQVERGSVLRVEVRGQQGHRPSRRGGPFALRSVPSAQSRRRAPHRADGRPQGSRSRQTPADVHRVSRGAPAHRKPGSWRLHTVSRGHDRTRPGHGQCAVRGVSQLPGASHRRRARGRQRLPALPRGQQQFRLTHAIRRKTPGERGRPGFGTRQRERVPSVPQSALERSRKATERQGLQPLSCEDRTRTRARGRPRARHVRDVSCGAWAKARSRQRLCPLPCRPRSVGTEGDAGRQAPTQGPVHQLPSGASVQRVS
jgi:hypothetical protein